MTPREFEESVAADYEARGYSVDLRGAVGDWGVDIIASRGAERLCIQAKMYAGARPVNRRQVFELSGAARYFDCTGAVIATDGELAPDAADAAVALGVAIWRRSRRRRLLNTAEQPNSYAVPKGPLPSFEELWETRVMPLAGTTLKLPTGGTNRILAVDWGGVRRVTSTGRRGRIPIEPFVWAIRQIRERGSVTRSEINAQFEGRFSSGVILILSQIPELRFQMSDATLDLSATDEISEE